jgi:hypothetical protein
MSDEHVEQLATIDPPRAIRIKTSTGWADLALAGPPGAPAFPTPVVNGQWINGQGGAAVWAPIGVFTDYVAVTDPNTDIPWPGGPALSTFIPINDASGTIRNLGAPPGDDGTRGTRATLINWSGEPLTIKFGTAGTGAKFWFQADVATDHVMAPNECMEFVFDGVWWDEVFTSYPKGAGSGSTIAYVGTYDAAHVYHDGDYVVGPDGQTYQCVKEGTTGVTPAPWTTPVSTKITTGALSAGPPAAPASGDIWHATGVDANGTVWSFVYDPTQPTYKWCFIGGGPLALYTGGGNVSGTSAFVDFPSSTSLTVARAGRYIVRSGFWAAASAGGTFEVVVLKNGAIINTTGEGYTPAATAVAVPGMDVAIACAAGDVLKLQYWANAGGSFGLYFHSITPVAIS